MRLHEPKGKFLRSEIPMGGGVTSFLFYIGAEVHSYTHGVPKCSELGVSCNLVSALSGYDGIALSKHIIKFCRKSTGILPLSLAYFRGSSFLS